METGEAAVILERIEDIKNEMHHCCTIMKLLDTKMAIHVNANGRDGHSFSIKAPAIRTAMAGLLKANYEMLAAELEDLMGRVKGWQ